MLNSLKSTVLFYFILFITVPLLLSTAYIFYKIHESKKASIYSKHLQILKRVESESNNIVLDVERTAKYIQDNFTKDRENLINDITSISPYISSILILDQDAQLLKYSTSVPHEDTQIKDFSKEVFFANLKNKKDFWSDIFLSKLSGEPTISYSYRIDEKNIIVLIVNLSTVNDFAKRFKSIDGESAVRMMNKDGYFLANPDHPEFVLERRNIKKSSFYKQHIVNDHEREQIEFHDLEGNNSIAVYAITEKLKWYILVKESYDVLFENFYILLWTILFFIAIVILISIFISIRLSKSILSPLELLNKNMNNITNNKKLEDIKESTYKELDNLSSNFNIMQKKIKNREEKILLEVEKNREKDIQLFEQSKMAALGEMIGNIAHQWRQPLSVISTVSTGIQIQNQHGVYDISNLDEACTSINSQTQYLSQTIDDFKNFIKGDRVVEEFSLKEFIGSFLHLVASQIHSNKLEVLSHISEDILCTSLKNDLLQSTINIFNNASDALSSCEHKYIFITIEDTEDNILFSIKDSAGGIPKDIINRIFEPYFTTKHKSKGTGLGLNMTYNLIVNGLQGNIKVENETYTYKDLTLSGANFIIILPKELKDNDDHELIYTI
jgi:signal transduction histidine kinase